MPTPVLTGESPHNAFIAGHYFELTEHPRDAFNDRYLITECRQHGEQPQVYEEAAAGGSSFASRVSCIPLAIPYRPPRITPTPTVEGSQTALVVGPRGEEIYTDALGRVKVQLHWDREGQWNEDSSCWIRVSQGLGRTAMGRRHPAPHRPGGHRRCPPGRPGPTHRHRLRLLFHEQAAVHAFEEKKGEEQIFIHGEKNLYLRIKNDDIEWVGHNQHLIVTQDKLERVDNERHEQVASDHMEKIGKDRHVST